MRLVASVLVFFFIIFFFILLPAARRTDSKVFYLVITIFNKINNTGVEELMHGG